MKILIKTPLVEFRMEDEPTISSDNFTKRTEPGEPCRINSLEQVREFLKRISDKALAEYAQAGTTCSRPRIFGQIMNASGTGAKVTAENIRMLIADEVLRRYRMNLQAMQV